MKIKRFNESLRNKMTGSSKKKDKDTDKLTGFKQYLKGDYEKKEKDPNRLTGFR